MIFTNRIVKSENVFMKNIRTMLITALLALLWGSGAWAAGDTSILYSFSGDSAGDSFGSSVSSAGDVNGDGYPDLVVGAPYDDNNGIDSGSARVLSGLDGNILYVFNGTAAGDRFGTSVSNAGDVNGDSYADVVVGAPFDDSNGADSGSARVFSGLDGSIIYIFNGDSPGDRFGISVGTAGDVNKDNSSDVIVGAYLDDNNGTDSGSARVFSGADGNIIYTFNGASAYEYFGYSVSDAGDVNSDTYADLIVGAPRIYSGGTRYARLFSGLSGSAIYTFNEVSADSDFGYSVSGAGDVNGDGYDDVIIGSPREPDLDPQFYELAGAARVYSGKTYTVIYTLRGKYHDQFGASVSGAGDINADGYADFIIGLPNCYNGECYGKGAARVYSGINAALIYTASGDQNWDEMGFSVSGAGDVNGDGYEDLVAGARYSDKVGVSSGSVSVIDVKYWWFDADADGVFPGDNCPSIFNPDQADLDEDTKGNACDNCPSTVNHNQANFDDDAQGDACDTDNDNDGVADSSDKFNKNFSASSDDDNDGFPGSWNAACDTICQSAYGLTLDNCPSAYNYDQANFDGDSQGDECDTDDDNDGLLDVYDLYDLDNTRAGDYDGDGVDSFSDNCPINYNITQANFDGDSQGDACDSDDDNDSVSDNEDRFPRKPAASSDVDGDGFPGSWNAACDTTCQANSGLTLDNCPLDYNANQANFDGDTLGNVCDPDDDNDGVADSGDAFDFDPTESVDTDGDGIGNNSDSDDDNDAVIDTSDNCPSNSNDNQANFDGDSQGDACDTDDDNDGWTDTAENSCGTVALDNLSVPEDTDGDLSCNVVDTDDDNDQLPDSWEELYGLDTLYNDAGDDMDSDGFTNLQEYQNGTDPYVADLSVAVKNDFDKDGDGDLFWRDSASGSNVVWILQGGLKVGANVLGSNATSYTVEAIADFDGDRDSDVLFRNNATGQSIIWTLENGLKAGATVLGTNAATYSIKGVADFDGDGDADILFRDTAGNNLVWTIQNAAKVGAVVLGANAATYSVEGTQDFDADGDADILFRDNTSGQSILWRMQNNAKVGAVVLGTNAATYSIKGVADFNNDGDADILFRDTSGANLVWTIQNAAKTGAVTLGSNSNMYSVAATADFDADGDADILFRDTAGNNVIWVMQNHAKTSASVLGSNASSYSVAGTADADGDGDEDILFRNNATGANVLWLIQAKAKAAANVLSTNAATMEAKFEE